MQKTLEALSNTTRLKLLICLSESEKNVTQLIDKCDLSQSAVSQHLKKLKDAGLIESKKSGREQNYKVRNKSTIKIAKELLKFLEGNNI